MAPRGAHPWWPAAPGRPSRCASRTCTCRAASIFPVHIRGCGTTGAQVRRAAEATAIAFIWKMPKACNSPWAGTTPAMMPKALPWNRFGYGLRAARSPPPSIRPIEGAHHVETRGRVAVRGFVGIGIPFERQVRDHSRRLIRAPVLDHVAFEMCLLPDHADLSNVAGHAMLRERALEGLERHWNLHRPGIREPAFDALLGGVGTAHRSGFGLRTGQRGSQQEPFAVFADDLRVFGLTRHTAPEQLHIRHIAGRPGIRRDQRRHYRVHILVLG